MANKFLQDDNGNNSSMRLLVAFVVVAIVSTWMVVSIRTNVMAPLDMGAALTAIGALVAKGYQKSIEVKNGGGNA